MTLSLFCDCLSYKELQVINVACDDDCEGQI